LNKTKHIEQITKHILNIIRNKSILEEDKIEMLTFLFSQKNLVPSFENESNNEERYINLYNELCKSLEYQAILHIVVINDIYFYYAIFNYTYCN